MIAFEVWLAFLGYSVPMVFSPGPGNTVLATSGSRYGVRGSLPFWAGFELANVALCLVYGLGLGRALQDHPEVQGVLRWAGVVYLLYLAFGFFRASAAPAEGHEEQKLLGWVDGFVSVALNPKIHTMIAVMFSQFLNRSRDLVGQTLQLSAAFLVVCLACHLPWIVGGQVILGRFKSARAMRIQGWTFGICMVLVAGYVALT